MTKNPFVNACAATGYIALVASLMFYGPKLAVQQEDSVIMPIAMISLLTLSVAMMGYIFISKPLQMYLDGSKQPAVKLFLQTLTTFAAITIIAFVILLTGVTK